MRGTGASGGGGVRDTDLGRLKALFVKSADLLDAWIAHQVLIVFRRLHRQGRWACPLPCALSIRLPPPLLPASGTQEGACRLFQNAGNVLQRLPVRNGRPQPPVSWVAAALRLQGMIDAGM